MSMTRSTVGPASLGQRANVHVTGRRIVSTFIDGLVIGGLYNVMAASFGTITTEGSPTHWRSTMSVAATIAYGVLVALYFIVLEGPFGKTLGKAVTGIRVVSESDGQPPGLGRATVRTALRIVDGLFSYLVAFIAVLASPKRQRLGDMAARTLVVRD
jgi:uncharacterized RDD family membrane protein YckC